MKKYRVKQKWNGVIFGDYRSRKEASDELMAYIHNFNKDFEGEYLSPFDYELEEAECKEVNETITDFETARKVLGVKPNMQIKDAERLVSEINPKHLEALNALNRLFTIAEAWNKADGFVPDFSDIKQKKWFPKFKYDKDAAGFVYLYTDFSCSFSSGTFGKRICFKTSERAEQFGKKFAELYNKVFI